MSLTQIKLTKLPIELAQFLKYCGIADTGGQAKCIIQEKLVTVNGNIEVKKSRKLLLGDRIKVDTHEYEIISH
jgi:ribosome-associated protein